MPNSLGWHNLYLIKIIISHNYSNSQVSLLSYTLANHLANEGHQVLFFSHQPRFDKEFSPLKNLRIISWPQQRPTGIQSLAFYYKEHKKFKPDITIAHFAAIPVVGLASRLLGCKQRWAYYHTAEQANITENAANPFLSWLKRKRKSAFYLLYNKVICVSQFAAKDAQHYFKIPAQKLQIVYNAVPDRWTESCEKLTFPVKFHYLGRLDPAKNVLEMTDAFASFLQEKNANAILSIAGSGTIEDKVKAAAAVHQGIEFRGLLPYEQVDKFIEECHYLVSPSQIETFGMVNAEAIMNATPVLANAVGGIPEIIQDAKNGFLSTGFTTADWAALFKKAYDIYTKENAVYKTMQFDCRDIYEQNFTIHQYIKEMTKLITATEL